MQGTIFVFMHRAQGALAILLFLVALAGCKADDPNTTVSDIEVCCLDEDGLTSLVASAACEESYGTVVEDKWCEDDIVSLCCMTKDGNTSTMTNVQCDQVSGNPVALEYCKEDVVSLCCELPDGTTTYMTNVECKEAQGAHVALSECQEDPPTFCCVVDGVYLSLIHI